MPRRRLSQREVRPSDLDYLEEMPTAFPPARSWSTTTSSRPAGSTRVAFAFGSHRPTRTNSSSATAIGHQNWATTTGSTPIPTRFRSKNIKANCVLPSLSKFLNLVFADLYSCRSLMRCFFAGGRIFDAPNARRGCQPSLQNFNRAALVSVPLNVLFAVLEAQVSTGHPLRLIVGKE